MCEVLSTRHIYSLAVSSKGIVEVKAHQIFTILCATKITTSTFHPHKISQHIHIWNGPTKISMWNFHMNTQVHHTSTDRILCIDLYDIYAKRDQVAKYPDGQSCHHMCLKAAVPFWGRTSPPTSVSVTWPLKPHLSTQATQAIVSQLSPCVLLLLLSSFFSSA